MAKTNPPAYRSISDSVRRDIIARRLVPGDRLPVETELAEHFAVSRSTIREVLRDLTSQNLVETTRGATGGTFVVVPRPDAMARSLGVGITMLANSDTLSVAQMLEAREILEVPLARLACERATDDEIQQVCSHCDLRVEQSGEGRDLASNWGFHTLISKAAGNPLLELMAEPILFVLETRFATVSGSNDFVQNVESQHQQIAEMMKQRDADGCATAMQEHLDFLRPYYRNYDARLSPIR
jgi:GntR family transcriptional repressor for pyruvate dehydrogenase complex